MLLPFMYSLKDAALDLLGIALYYQIPEETIGELYNNWIVDSNGI